MSGRAVVRLLFLQGPDSCRNVEINGDDVVVCFDWWTRESLAAQGIRHVVADDYISCEYGVNLDKALYELAWSWSEFDGREFSEWRGVPLGRIYYVELVTGYFVPYVRTLCMISRAVAAHSPSEIWTDFQEDSVQVRVLDLCCKAAGVPWRLLREGGTKAISSAKPVQPMPKGRIEQLVFRSIKYVRSLFATCARGSTSILVFPYRSLVPIVDVWRQPDNGLPRLVVPTLGSRRLALSMVCHGAAALDLSPIRLDAMEKGEIQAIMMNWEKIKQEPSYQARYRFEGVEAFSLFEPILTNYVTARFVRAAGTIKRVERELLRHQVGVVVVPFDTTEMEGIAVHCARRMGIKTYVLLHGLVACPSRPHYKRSFYGEQADRLVVWSKALHDLMVNGFELPVGRLEISQGMPSLERCVKQSDMVSSLGGGDVLIVTNMRLLSCCLGSDLDPEEHLVGVLQAIQDVCPEKLLVIKPHPGESEVYYARLVDELRRRFPRLNVRLSLDQDIAGLLRRSQVVIAPNNSGVMLDAASLGVPVVLANFSKWGMLPQFNGAFSFQISRSPKELTDELFAVLQGSRKQYYLEAASFVLNMGGGVRKEAARAALNTLLACSAKEQSDHWHKRSEGLMGEEASL